MNDIGKIRDKWDRGELCVGTAVSLTDAAISELYGEAGYDFLWLDCEHSVMGPADALNHVRAARGAGAATFIRVPSNDPVVMKPYLDVHPAGIIVPRIESVADAERAVVGCRYPPRGIRGYGPVRGVKFGAIPPPDYLESIDRQLMLILQIEHIDAVNQIDAILDVPGVDSVVTGPADLSGTMGLGGRAGDPEAVAAIETVCRAAVARGIPAGHITAYDPEGIRRWLALGLSWITVECDWATLARRARVMAEGVREAARLQRRADPR